MIIWNPTLDTIFSGSNKFGKIPLIISPYCKTSSLNNILESGTVTEQFELVVRFSAREISQGATDLDIFELLMEKGHKLYAHPHIHLKLYLFGPNNAFLTSSNLTQRGLGVINNRNIETGTFVELGPEDWIEINNLLETCRLVTPNLVDELRSHKSNSKKIESILDDFYSVDGYSLLDLPSMSSPQDFIEGFINKENLRDENLQQYLCDYAKYRGNLMPIGQDPSPLLKREFLAKPFISNFCNHLRVKKSMRFGEVTHWFHNNISERPLPLRIEVKDIVSRIYTWLPFFEERISWDIPGEHSQVMRWTERKETDLS